MLKLLFLNSLMQAALEAALTENTALASEYKTFQESYLDEKDKYMVNYESRLRIEATIRDYLQVSQDHLEGITRITVSTYRVLIMNVGMCIASSKRIPKEDRRSF